MAASGAAGTQQMDGTCCHRPPLRSRDRVMASTAVSAFPRYSSDCCAVSDLMLSMDPAKLVDAWAGGAASAAVQARSLGWSGVGESAVPNQHKLVDGHTGKQLSK